MPNVEVSLWPVIISAIAVFVLGGLWYSPMVLGKQWMKAIGKTKEELEAGGGKAMFITPIIGSLIMAYVLAHFLQYAEAVTTWEGILTGFWVWLGFVATTMATNMTFAPGANKMKLFTINAGYHLVSLLIMGVILAAW